MTRCPLSRAVSCRLRPHAKKSRGSWTSRRRSPSSKLAQASVESAAVGAPTGDDFPAMCAPCDDEAGADGAAENATATTPAAMLSPASTVGEMLRLFLEQQEERVSVYRKFEEGFQLFLRVAEAQGYQGLVTHTTAAFAEISKRVNSIEAELRTRGAVAEPLAATVRTVQELEREKLQITAQLHILRHGLAIDELQRRASRSRRMRGALPSEPRFRRGGRGCGAACKAHGTAQRRHR